MSESETVMANEEDLLCRLSVSAESFSKDWAHCDQLSNYLSRIVSFDKPDSFIFSNLLSTVLNEILEVLFFNHSNNKSIVWSLYQQGENTVIVSDIPVDSQIALFYSTAASNIENGDPSEMYRSEMSKEGGISRAIGLYELAADYGAKISIREQPEHHMLRLYVSVQLDKFVEGCLDADND